MKNQRGVTLIELIIVIVIIAIGATLLTPGISSWIHHYRLRSATREIASVMRIAQMKAISNNLTYQVVFDPPNRSYILQYDTGGGIVDDGSAQFINNTLQMNTTLPGNIAMFRSDSTVTGGNVILTNSKGSQKTIRLAGGRIRIE